MRMETTSMNIPKKLMLKWGYTEMDDSLISVLNSENIRVDQGSETGYRLVIRRTTPENRMKVERIVSVVKASRNKPVVIYLDDLFRGSFADKKEVLSILQSREDYREYLCWLAEAKMNGM